MTTNGSMAIWCALRHGAAAAKIEAHLNYWRIAGDANFRGQPEHPPMDFIEVGVMLAEPHSISKVCVHFPYQIEPNVIEDCGSLFHHTNIAQGIFNEVLTCTLSGPPGPESVELKRGEDLYCKVHKFIHVNGLIDNSQLSVDQYHEGTLLTITDQAIEAVCNGLPAGDRAYFRLRIYIRKADDSPFIRVIPPQDRLLQSGFDEIEYVDFRLNEARTLPARVEAKIRADEANGKVALNLVAFLTAVPVLSELATSNTKWHKNRLLEHEIWNSYVPSGIPEGMMVYHWKQEDQNGVSDFSSFVKLQTRRSGRGILLKYLAIAFLFGILGNLAAATLWELGKTYEWLAHVHSIIQNETPSAPPQ